MKRFVVILSMMVVMSGCSVTRYVEMGETYEKEFIGMYREYVEYVCGTPSSVGKSGDDVVLLYDDVDKFAAATGHDIAMPKKKDGVVMDGYVQMFFGTDGLCYSVRTNHTKAVRETDKTKTWATVAGCCGGGLVVTSLITILMSLIAY